MHGAAEPSQEYYREYIGYKRSITKDFEKGLLFIRIKHPKRAV
jgi:hypothetical protein